MSRWGLLRRRAVAEPVRSNHRKQRDASRSRLHRTLRIEQFEERALLSIGAWMPLGPSPIINGQTENVAPKDLLGQYLNQVVGAIQAVAVSPTNADLMYVGTVNGGIWRTNNATAANPTWTPLTDSLPSLSIASIALDPTDASGQTIVAGVGRTSDYYREGCATLTGILRSTDSGVTWSQLTGNGTVTLTGKNCSGIAVRGNTILVSVDNATSGSYNDVGIFRSTDGGATFSQISSGNGSSNGLPGGIAYDLAADPVTPSIFYTAIVGATTFGGKNGIYKSTNSGATWTKVSDATVDAFINTGGVTVTHAIRISVGNAHQVYVGIADQDPANPTYDQLAAVFRGASGGTVWTAMDLPQTDDGTGTNGIELPQVTVATGDPLGTLPSGKGSIGFSIAADPSNPNFVYVGGGAQPVTGGDSAIGAQSLSGRLFRGDASQPTGSQWVSLTNSNSLGPTGGGTANDSSPAAGSRDMVFDSLGRLIEVDGGGVYARTNPESNTGDWISLNGTLQITEFHDVAYDTISNVVIGGAEDTGVSEETATGSTTWREVNSGNGGAVAVDDTTLASLNESYRYTASEDLAGFERQTVDANNNVLDTENPALMVTEAGADFYTVDGGQFVTPVVLNAVDPSRMVIGGSTSVFESFDRGETLTDLTLVPNAHAMVYGGYLDRVANPDVLWVVSDTGVYLRTSATGTLAKTGYTGGAARDIVVDPTDWQKAYVIDANNIYYTADGGGTWTNITHGDARLVGLQSVQFVAAGNASSVLVGGQNGVFESQGGTTGVWNRLGADLPNVAVESMVYDSQDDVLIVGTLGRGAWELRDIRPAVITPLTLLSVSTDTTTYTNLATVATITASPLQLTLHFNEGQVINAATLAGIQITRAGADGAFYDPVTNPYDTDDVVIVPGYVSLGDNSNDVIIRFSQALPDDLYRVTIVGQGTDGVHTYYGSDGKAVSPLTNSTGIPVQFGEITSGGQSYWDGHNFVWSFNLTLPPQVTAVVPQPITRAADGTLSQARNQIEVYFSDAMDVASAETTSFYALINTADTANTADDVVTYPTSADYDPLARKVTLTFAQDSAGNTITDLAQLGTEAFRLRVGDQYQVVGAAQGGQGGNIVTTERTDAEAAENDATDSTFVGATDLGNFSTYSPNPANPLPPSTPQSWVISGDIGARPYVLEWPGGQDTPGSRSLPDGATDVSGENHVPVGSGDVGPDGEIPTLYYNFQTVYGYIGNTPMSNLITATQEQRVRDCFSLFTQYFGVQFVETANQGATIATGDLRVFGSDTPTGAGSAAGMEGTGYNNNPLVVINNFYNWGNDEFGGSYMSTVMHEIMHTLGFGHSYDLAGPDIMGSDPDVASSAEASFPDNGDIVSGQYMYRPDSMDIDLYKFDVGAGGGDFSAETIAQRLQDASGLNSALVLFDSQGNVVARNDDYYGTDSFVSIHLAAGTYYIGVSASGNDQYNPNIPDSGVGGTTEGAYQLRLTLKPAVITQLESAQGIALDGDADGTAGGEYNYWFNVQTASSTAAQNHTLIVDKKTTGVVTDTGNGTLANPYNNISTAIAAAKAGDIIRVVGNNSANDDGGHGIQAVAGSTLTDGQTFKISDAGVTYTFEFDSNSYVLNGNIRIPFTSSDSKAQIAAKIATAINSVSWIPAGLSPLTPTRKVGGLDATATVSAADNTVVDVDGPTVTIDLGTSKLLSTLQDNKAYEIGTDQSGAALSDGKKLEVPKGVTLIFDAGAVVKLRGANVDVGSSAQNIDRSLGSVQVLGVPGESVYFTSYWNARLGTTTVTSPSAPAAAGGDWGGLVFRNNYDYQEQVTDLSRQVLEQQGIFLDYVNHADISYGGGKVTVNGVQNVYDPVDMIEARPTISFNTITHSADAAMSADPNSLEESSFYDRFGETLYTNDYGRVGPDIHGNVVQNNSINGLYLRVATNAGQSLENLSVPARFNDVDIVLTVPENVVIQGDSGENLEVTGTCALQPGGRNELVVPSDSTDLADRQYFYLSDGATTVRFEFDPANNGVNSGSVAIPQPGDENLSGEQQIVNSINYAQATYGLKITAKVAADGNVELDGTSVVVSGLSGEQARMAGSLVIDPGSVVKLSGTRIEVGMGAQLIAEGTAASPIVFTSMMDDTYGAGGTFDTTNNSAVTASPGDWGGLYFSPTSRGSLDYARVFYAGGNVAIEGGFASFAPIDIRQATVRIADSLFQHNTGTVAGDRNGRGTILDAAVIYVRFAQPVIVNNVFRDNQAEAISMDVNSLNGLNVADWGRSTGDVSSFDQFAGNFGPLVRLNRLSNNFVNGMVVRGGTLTTEGIWDDTDIVHVVHSEIVVPNLDTYGALRLESSTTASLVVKLSGSTAGFTATGTLLEITDRVGGTVQVIGQPGHPVVLTSLADDTVGAGFDVNGNPMDDTDNTPATPNSGDWQGIKLEQYSNDSNVAVVVEAEPSTGASQDSNGTINTAQPLGELASSTDAGDDVLRLGFEVHGTIAFDRPSDTDVYSFQGYAGTEVWIAIDRTSFSLDSVVELIDADGNVIAKSDNWRDETNTSTTLDSSAWTYQDVYSTNPLDAGLHLVLPGPTGQQRTYYIRVSSAPALSGAEQTSGEYQLQVRLQPVYLHPGSTVRYADIRYATNGIDTSGLPGDSPLTSDTSEAESYDPNATQNASDRTNTNDTFATAQPIGNLLQSPEGEIDLSGRLDDYIGTDGTLQRDVDWYKFTVDYGDTIERISGVTTSGSVYPVTFDIDYADGLARPDTTLWIFDQNGKLILDGTDSGVVDDQPSPNSGADLTNLTAGSVGTHDPYVGPVYLMEGQTYYVAVTCSDVTATAGTATTAPLVRYEPVDSVQRIAEDNIGSQNASGLDPAPSTTLFPGTDAATVNLSAEPYHLSDVVMYVQTDAGLETVDPFTGAVETALSSTGSNVGDIAMVPGTNSDGTTGTYAGTLYSISRGATSNYVDQSQAAGIVSAIDTGTGSAVSSVWDGLITYRYSTIPNSAPALEEEGDNTATTVAPEPGGVSMEAMANSGSSWFVIGNADRLYTDGGTDNPSNPQGKDDPNLPAEVTNSDNLLYMLNSSGTAIDAPGQVVTDDATTPRLTTNIIPLASLTTDDHVGSDGKPDHNPAFIGSITGLSFVGGNLYAVTNTGNLYQILNYSSPGFTPTPNPDNTTDYETIKSISGGPSLHYIGTVKTDGTNPTNVDFAGLTTGPKDVDNAAYANMLFGISRTGDLYALGLTTTTNPTTGVTTTTVAKQGIFLDSKTHITIPNLTTVSGLAFSTLDANMWHVTDNSDPGHSTNVTYDESRTVQLPTDPTTNECFYFGQNESLSTATPGNYDAPGGDYGSLITQPFSLANYSASDVPTLYFDYALDNGVSPTGPQSNYDTARVFASDDGVTWHLLGATLDNPNGDLASTVDSNGIAQWQQFRLVPPLDPDPTPGPGQVPVHTWSLADFAGDDNIRLRFDFSTAGDMHVGSSGTLETGGSLDTTGAYLAALSGESLNDGDAFTVDHHTFQFDMGMALDLPNVAGNVIPDGETFTITGLQGGASKTFEFDFDVPANVAAGHVAIPIQLGETSVEVATEIAAIVNGQNLVASDGKTKIVADAYQDRVMLNGAGGLTQSSNPTVTAVGNGSGKPTTGVTLVPISSTSTAQQVAQAMADALQKVFGTPLNTDPTKGAVVPFDSFKVDNVNGDSIVRMIGHVVSNAGPLPYANHLAGDNNDPLVDAGTTQFTTTTRGQDNNHGGFYIDNVIIGFAERGEMITDAAGGTTTFTNPTPAKDVLTKGAYQLQIREASAYATWDPTNTKQPLTLTNSFDVNDRLDDSYTLIAPAAYNISQGDTFTIGDGVTTLTFQFIDSTYPGGNPDNIPVYFSAGDSATTVAAAIATAVNGAEQNGLFKVTASMPTDTNGNPVGDRVNLFGAVKVTTPFPTISGSTPTHVSTPVGFNEDTSLYVGLHVANPLPTDSAGTYVVYDPSSYGGAFSDAEKSLPLAPAGSTVGTGDDFMDWAAAAANVLAWTGWGEVKGMTTADAIFQYFQAHWTDQPNWSLDAWIWWFTGQNPDRRTTGVATVKSPGGGFYRSLSISNYVQTQTDPSQAMSSLDEFLHNGEGVVLGLQCNDKTDAWYPMSHAVTAWGFTYDTTKAPTDPNYYTGVYITDSDDNQAAAGTASPDELKYYKITYSASDGVYYLTDYYGRNTIYIDDVSGLQKRFAGIQSRQYTGLGDQNQVNEQGEVILESNRITYSANYGIVVASADGMGDVKAGSTTPYGAIDLTSPGPTAPLREINTDHQVPGVVIENNVIAFGTNGGIDITGPAATTGPSAGAVPFARIVNNTIYGGANRSAGVGVNVGVNASPTILNNVVANFNVGIQVDPTSSTTVVGTTAYSGNTTDLTGDTQTFAIDIGPNDPLFVNAAAGNFYPAEGSRIIDSSLDSLQDRANMVEVRDPLGIPPSPILAPDYDELGQLRMDDPSVSPPSGMGTTIYKDRGAIDRVDFDGPTATLVDPMDNDPAGVDRNPAPNDVTIAMIGDTTIDHFTIQLDDAGAGVDNSTVTTANVQLLEDGKQLTDGFEYFFTYDSTNHTITLAAAAGTFESKHTYTVLLTSGIQDLAANPIQSNRSDGTTEFNITLAGYNFGTAPMNAQVPDPNNPGQFIVVDATRLPDGARSLVVPGVYLGNSIDTESDATVTAAGDSDDDGVAFPGGNYVISPAGQAGKETITVTASCAGYLDAWIDWNGDGVWETAAGQSEQISFTDADGKSVMDPNNHGAILHAGANTLVFTVPSDLADTSSFKTFARFRFSTTGMLSDGVTPMQVTGEASDGEVEDYQIAVIPYLTDWGDAPDPTYPTLPSSNGASARVLTDSTGAPTLCLGHTVTPQVAPVLNGTSYDGFDFSTVNLIPGRDATISFYVTNTTGQQAYLNGWIDFNGDGTWNTGSGSTEIVANSLKVQPGENTLTIHVPADAVVGNTFARFRLSLQPALSPKGADVVGGEVEDYQVSIQPPPGQITGTVWNDRNGNGVHDAGEPGLAGWTVYLDANNNGVLDAGERTATTAADGSYTFTDVFAGTYTVREVPQSGWNETGPSGNSYTVTMGASGTISGEDFFNRDVTPPKVLSIVKGNGVTAGVDPTNAAVVHFAVLFSEPVTGVDATDFTIVAPFLTNTSIAGITFHDGIYDVAVNTGSGVGSLQLKLIDDDSIKDIDGGNPLGGTGIGNGNFAGPSYTIDHVAPKLLSIALASPNPTNADTVAFTVTFSEPVTGVDATDFTAGVSGLTGTFTPVVAGSGAVYTVTLPTGAGDGTLSLNVVNDGTIADLAGNVLTGALPVSPSYTIDKIPPTVVSSVRAGPSPTTASTLVFTVTFSETVTGVDTSDFALNTTGVFGASVYSVSGSGAVYSVTVKTGTGDGTIQLQVIDDNSIRNAAGNMLGGPALHDGDFLTGDTYTIDRSDPTALNLSNARVAEHLPVGTVVGFLSSVGPHGGNYTYTLVSGTGSTDNGSFLIAGNYLETNNVFDFATKSSYQIRIRTTDSSNYYLEQTFTISVVAEANTVAIGDLVWNDTNGNGLQDSGEPGIGGTVVELYVSPSGTVGGAGDYLVDQKVTDSNGKYSFDNLLPHADGAPDVTYYLVALAPSGYTFTTENVGGNDAIDSDVNSNGVSAAFTLSTTMTDVQKNSFDVGLVPAPYRYDFALSAGSTGDDSGQAIATDSAGNVYVAGLFHGTVDFGAAPGVHTLYSSGGSDVFVAKYTSTGSLLWVVGGGSAGDDSANGIAIGPDGNIYVAGGYSGAATFGSGATSASLTSAGGEDAFVLKLSPDGSVMWARGMGGTGNDVANSIAVAADGSVYTTGGFQGTADFDPGAGVSNLTAVGPTDIFVAKLDFAGNYVWAKRMGGIGWSQGTSIGMGITVAADGSVYTTGSFQGTANFDPNGGQHTLVCAGGTDVFVSKLDSSGNYVWARGMGGPGADYGADITVGTDGSVYTVGSFIGIANFNPGPGVFNLDSAGYHRTFISKLDSAGNFVWAGAVGGTGWDQPTSIAMAADGSLLIAGGFYGIADFDPGAATYQLSSLGQKDVFLLNLTASGNFVSAERFGGTGDDCANAIAVTSSGTVYMTGYFQGTANFAPPGSPAWNLTSAGGEDIFVAKYPGPAAGPLTVTINQGPTQADPTLTGPIDFRVVFSLPVTDFTADDVTLGGTLAGSLSDTVTMVGTDGTTYDVSVTGMSGTGTVTASIAAGVAHDSLSRANAASTSTDNSVTFGSVTVPVISNVTVAEASTPKNGILEPGDLLVISWNVTTSNGFGPESLTVDGNSYTPTMSVFRGTVTFSCNIGSWPVGAHAYTIHATDTLGGSADSSGTFNVVAASGPTVSSVVVAEAGTVKNGILESNEMLRITWAASSSKGIASQTMTVDGKTITPISGPYSNLYFSCTIGTWTAGSHSYTIHSTDSQGASSDTSGTFTVYAPTTTPPSITSVVVAEAGTVKNGILESNEPLRITWSATSPYGIASQTMTVDGKAIAPINGPYGGQYFSCTIGTWAAGSHNYTIHTTDTKGVSSDSSASFTVVAVTTTPPVITSVVVAEAGTVKNGILESNEPLRITWSATSSYGIASQTMTVDGKAIAPINGPYGGQYFSCTIGTWAAGSHNYTIHTTDKNGVSSDSSASFTVVAATTTPPSITSVVVAEAGTVKNGILESNEPLRITWSATSSYGVASQTMTVDGKAIGPINGPYGGQYFSCTIGTWAAGSHNYTIHTTDKNGVSSDSSAPFTVVSALMVAASAAPQGSAADLTNAELTPIVAEAVHRLEAQLSSQVETAMAGVNIKIANLSPGMLGETSGKTIWIDDDAAGYGWFVDATPADDAEFTPLTATDLVAKPGSAAANRADLLTTVMHEMGHVLGYEHSNSLDLMAATLPLGERRSLAGGADASDNGALDEVFASLNANGKTDWS